MLATLSSATLLGAGGRPVTVEVHVSPGLPAFSIVGLPDEACRESRDRVRAALLSSSLPWPLKRVTVNLAPGDVRKGGSGLDLPIAIGLLVANGALEPEAVAGHGFLGELGLDGTVRRVPGIVPLVDATAGDTVVVPAGCGREAALGGARCRAPRRNVGRPGGGVAARGRLARRPAVGTARVDTRPARPRRRPRSAGRPPCPRGRGRGRPPPLDGRPAGVGQIDARPPSRRPATAAARRPRARGHHDPLGGGRRAASRRPHHPTTATGSSPRRVRRRARRRRQARCCGRARCRSRIGACCSSTSSASSPRRCSTASASPSRRVW